MTYDVQEDIERYSSKGLCDQMVSNKTQNIIE